MTITLNPLEFFAWVVVPAILTLALGLGIRKWGKNQ